MTSYSTQLRQRFLISMGLGSMSLSLLMSCDSAPDSVDADGDGFMADEDCDDSDEDIHPDAEEVCDGKDNDCDGDVDDDAKDSKTWYADTDKDGYGDAATTKQSCEAPDGFVADRTDCLLESAESHPGAKEILKDRVDNNCNGMVDEMVCPEASPPKGEDAIYQSKGREPFMFCVDRPADGLCPEPEGIRTDLVYDTVGSPGGPCGWEINGKVCGPDIAVDYGCCYVFKVDWECEEGPFGRPLTVEGLARVAPVVASTDWTHSRETVGLDLTSDQREAVIQRWLRAAQEEHASVASFARFTMELMALGAPPELLLSATRAQADEVVHARLCFTMASSLGGPSLGAGALDLSGALEAETTPLNVLVQTLLEGCIGEAVAAAQAAWLSEEAELNEARRVQKQIAEDEGRHAALGWKTARWLLQQHPELVDTAREVFANYRRELEASLPVDRGDEWMARYGCIPSVAAHRLRLQTWEQVIAPCAKALLFASQRDQFGDAQEALYS